MSFGILATVTSSGLSHSTGVIYGLSSPESAFALYVITGHRTRKARNVRANPAVSFVVPFPHYLLRFIPASVVQFQGTAEILPLSHEEGAKSFASSRVLRMSFRQAQKESGEEPIFIRILPHDHLNVYGLGFNPRQMMKDIAAARYSVTIPRKRRVDPGESSPPEAKTE